jgi:hypothetical protein
MAHYKLSTPIPYPNRTPPITYNHHIFSTHTMTHEHPSRRSGMINLELAADDVLGALLDVVRAQLNIELLRQQR